MTGVGRATAAVKNAAVKKAAVKKTAVTTAANAEGRGRAGGRGAGRRARAWRCRRPEGAWARPMRAGARAGTARTGRVRDIGARSPSSC
ncbi:hypothetical protein F3K40_21590 [Streptomyces sp. LBUM 1478]|nr:hypothetical protein [Streptomyces sp. LBUM 1485]MBP5891480.1 hypothetical protein [Streptomyces sp. LBUM 1481]MBP5907812.1 hypothetical protein [Streptomyces sp. LBUM 1478]MBP5914689.1 hypothetical protein [Streptomyces sp. LBUM 1486]MBP5921634.1 hypothetical protein [Streptomyces sp. LBUM 1483]QTU55884.1 hypothetical protein F3K21_26275 [Streptomyces sp. LBUM 1480]